MKTETWTLYRCTHMSPDWHSNESRFVLVECGAFEYVAPGFAPASVCSMGHMLKMVPDGDYELEVSE